jgi:1-acyl-sn-glycerol-3-phosphate acyltransferase
MPIDLTTAPPAPPGSPVALIRGGRARAALRLLGFLAWTFVWFWIWMLGSLLSLPVPRARLSWRHFSERHWARGLCRLAGMRRRCIGSPPRAPFLLVTNHLSYFDILLLFSWVDGVFVAKRDMRSWPLLGPLARLAGTIWVKREVRRDAVRALDRIDRAVARGDGVILFPEGTTSNGSGLLPMKPALLDWAAREQYPVHYAAISYRTPRTGPPPELVVCWWGSMPFASHLWNLLRLRSFDAMVEFGDSPISAPTRGELAGRLQREIAARFVPVGWRSE